MFKNYEARIRSQQTVLQGCVEYDGMPYYFSAVVKVGSDASKTVEVQFFTFVRPAVRLKLKNYIKKEMMI